MNMMMLTAMLKTVTFVSSKGFQRKGRKTSWNRWALRKRWRMRSQSKTKSMSKGLEPETQDFQKIIRRWARPESNVLHRHKGEDI